VRTNVYYLPSPAPGAERAPRLAAGLALRLRLLALWCRLRLTAVEVGTAIRRFGRVEAEADPASLELGADLTLALVPLAPRPARIIDFAAARARLRP
jgi:hypothetical protein